MRGLTRKQAARSLGISQSTVRSHLNGAYRRLGVSDATQAAMMALSNGWVEELLPDHAGRPYAAVVQRHKKNWLPSPAQRLYLDAFDVLLARRDEEAAERVDFFFGVMCRERGCPDRRGDRPSVNAMLLGLAQALRRPIAA